MNGSKLNAKATAGVYAEVMRQIYDSVDKRLREAVSNAHDAKATKVTIEVHLTGDDQIVITDDGVGMDAEDLRNNYISMGGGGKYDDEDSIGRIGIGALSIFALGSKIRVRTRKEGSGDVITAELDFSQLLTAEEHARPLDEVSLGRIKSIRPADEDDPAHFTEIVIRSLSKASKDLFGDSDRTDALINRLERVLPVALRSDDALLSRLSPEIATLLREDKYRIAVVFHCPAQNYEHYPILRRSILSEPNARISRFYPIHPYPLEGGYSTKLQLYGYMYINADKALPKDWQGINARVKNVTIEPNTLFSYERDAAATVRIGGELYVKHIDENNAIQSNRSGFAKENPDYLLVSQYMHGIIAHAVGIVRQNSEIDTIVKKVIGRLEGISRVLERSAAIEETKEGADSFKAVDDESVQLPDFIRPFDLEERLREELSSTGIDFDFLWSGVLADSYVVEYSEDDYYTIQVHERLREFVYDIGGNSVEYSLVYLGDPLPLIAKKPGVVLINLESRLVRDADVLKLDPAFLLVVLVMYLNYLRCNNDASELYYSSIADLA